MSENQKYRQYMNAAKNAHKAGDANSASRLIALARSLEKQALDDLVLPRNADGVPSDMFFNPETNQMTSRELLANKPAGVLETMAQGSAAGNLLNYSDELAGVIASGGGANTTRAQQGTPEQRRKFITELARARQQAAQRDRPNLYLGSEIGGALANPAALASLAKTMTVQALKGLAAGATSAAAYASGKEEGSAADRIDAAVEAAPYGAVFGAALPPAYNLLKGTVGKLARLFRKSEKAPTLQNLLREKSEAYRLWGDAGYKFGGADIASMAATARNAITGDAQYIKGQEKHIEATLKILKKLERNPNDLSAIQLDKIKQQISSIYGKGFQGANQYDPRVGAVRERLEALIQSSPDNGAAATAARLANSRYKKTELLEEAMDRAVRATERTGSGGNIANNYRAAADKILNSKDAKYFTDAEKAALRKIVTGDMDTNIMRLVGKTSPSGNGLSLMLNAMMGIQTGGASLAIPMAGMLAKNRSDTATQKAMTEMRDYLASGRLVAPQSLSGGPAAVGGVLGGQAPERNQ